MTTGSFTSGAMPNRTSKSWSGSDGKYSIGLNGEQVLNQHPYTMTRSQHSGSEGKNNFYYNLSNIAPFIPSSSETSDLRAQAKLVDKVRMHDFNLASFAGESRQLVSLIRSTVTTLKRALIYNRFATNREQYRKVMEIFGVRDHRSSYSKDYAQRWLEMQYGWIPLIDDVYSSAIAFERASAPPRRKVYRVSSSSSSPIDTSASPSFYSGKGTMKTTVRYIYELVESLSNTRQLGLENPLPALWEIMPYSFVLDWFIPIGTYLDNLAIVPQLHGRWCKTVVHKAVSHSNLILPFDDAEGAHSDFEWLRVERTVGTGFAAQDVATPRFKGFEKAATSLHIANAVAITTSLLQGRSVPRGF